MVSSGRHAVSSINLVLSIVIFAHAQTTADKISGETEIQLKPCQDLGDFKITVKSR